MTESIYRFIPFEQLVDIVQKNSLAFVHPMYWEDPYEGFVYKLAFTEEGRRIIQSLPGIDAGFVLGMLPRYARTLRAQSWSFCAESDAMWRIYSHHERALRIETDIELLKNLEPEIQHVSVEYNEISLKKQIHQMFEVKGETTTVHVNRSLSIKRKAFAHEQEIRLIHFDGMCMVIAKPPQEMALIKAALHALHTEGKITKEQFERDIANLEKEAKEPEWKIREIKMTKGAKNFIKSVLVHPQAPDWYCQTVKRFCENNGLTFLGKSKLYSLE